MDGFKNLLASKTIWGVVISLVTGLLSKYGYELTPELQDVIVTSVLDAISVGGGMLAVYGRVKATKKIGK